MPRSKCYLLITFLLMFRLACYAQTKHQIRNAEFIVRNVNVISMTNPEILPGQMVGIKDCTIVFIENDQNVKKLKTKAKVIDGKDKYLMPGMADMHCHFPEKKEIKNYFL